MSNTFEIIEHIGVLGERTTDTDIKLRKELNIVSWNNRKPLFDIREWSLDRSIARYGIRFNADELESLTELLISRRDNEHQQDS